MRQVGPKDWIIIGLVAAIVVGLGGYLLLRPGTDSASGNDQSLAATVTTSASTTENSPVPPSSPGSSLSTSTSARSSSPETAANSGDGVVDSAVQPPGMSTPAEPEAIGPFGDLARRIDGDPFAIGSVDAPVVMVEYADYRCPFCAKFSRTHLPDLIEKYVETGVMRFEWRDMPIFGPESERAAVAGRAAARQHKFFEFNAAVYAAAPDTGHPDIGDDDLVAFAAEAGVPDLEQFASDLDDVELATDVADDIESGSILGVPSVPAFVVNGYPLLGAQPIDQFYDLIDGALALHEKHTS